MSDADLSVWVAEKVMCWVKPEGCYDLSSSFIHPTVTPGGAA